MWESFIIQPMVNLLLWIYDTLGHGPQMFGLAIILFTIVIRLITWPLNASQVKGAQAMQELNSDKEWQEIQKKYAKDREKLAQEQMRIYKERGINPFASCLPTLIQFPIIIGLYQSIIRAMAATPLDMLNLARTIYPFQHVSNIIPNEQANIEKECRQPEIASHAAFPRLRNDERRIDRFGFCRSEAAHFGGTGKGLCETGWVIGRDDEDAFGGGNQ